MKHPSIVRIRSGSLAVVLLLATPVHAQRQPPPEGAQAWRDLRVVGEHGQILATQWSARNGAGQRTATVTLQAVDAALHVQRRAMRVYAGPAVLTSLAFRPGASLVTLVRGGAGSFVRFAIVPDGPASRVRVVEARVAASGDYRPAYAFACADPDGFAVIWQEASPSHPNDPRTWMGRLSETGQWLSPPHIVQVPWGFGAIAWNGSGYHLALYYDGSGAGQSRLTLVTLSREGQPEQHPWWLTEPDAIGDVQMLQAADGMHVLYRGGAQGTELMTIVSHAVGSWGRAEGGAQNAGSLRGNEAYALRVLADASVDIARVP